VVFTHGRPVPVILRCKNKARHEQAACPDRVTLRPNLSVEQGSIVGLLLIHKLTGCALACAALCRRTQLLPWGRRSGRGSWVRDAQLLAKIDRQWWCQAVPSQPELCSYIVCGLWRPWAWWRRTGPLILAKLSIEQGQVPGCLRIFACHRLLYGGAEFDPIQCDPRT
jgi:hypothetical protein